MTRLFVNLVPHLLLFQSNHRQVAEYIAECARILDKSGLKYQVRTLPRPCLELFG